MDHEAVHSLQEKNPMRGMRSSVGAVLQDCRLQVRAIAEANEHWQLGRTPRRS